MKNLLTLSLLLISAFFCSCASLYNYSGADYRASDVHYSRNISEPSNSVIHTPYEQTPETNEAPHIVISTPNISRGIKRLSTKRIKVKGRAIDKDGVYEVIVNGSEAQLQNDGYFLVFVPLEIGENTINVKATDTKMKTSYKKFKVTRKSQSINRLALVIGNSNYVYGGSLSNPVNDAISMNNSLKKLDFTVVKYNNCNQRTMKRAIDEFGKRLKNYDVGLFFYAGHGIQIQGNNYLIPIDAKLESKNDVEYDCVRADRILAKMESAESKANIVILDACRDNPFERSWNRGVKGKGLAFMNAPSGSIIAYATSPGSTAFDGSGVNGLYTSALLEHISTPNITIEDVFKRVRTTVLKRSGNKQIPWESTSLTGYFYFKKE